MSDALAQAPWLRKLAEVFADRPLYLVGGAVRNPLMGLPLSDVDVCGPTRPEEAAALCAGTAVHARIRAAHFGTVELHLTDENGGRHMAEYTTFREDSYRCGHRPDKVRFATDVPVDALRRDFSVNALYRELTPHGLGPVIDPTGGLAHMRAGVLHTVTPQPDQVLKDDGLRILRAVRFQAELDLWPTEALLESLTRHAPLLGDIAPERLREELVKTLLADLRYPMLKRRAPAAQTGLSVMEAVGAWPYVLGDLAYDRAATEALKRLADDEGDGRPGGELAPSGGGGDQPDTEGRTEAEGRRPGPCPDQPDPDALPLRMALLGRKADPAALERVMERLRFSQREISQSRQLLRLLQALEKGPLDPAEGVRAGLGMLAGAEKLLRALGDEAAAQRGGDLIRRLTAQGAPLRLSALALRGEDMLALCKEANAPPARIGGVLNRLWDRVSRGELPNDREALLPAARVLLQEKAEQAGISSPHPQPTFGR